MSPDNPATKRGLARVAAHVLLWQDGRFLMLRRHRTGFEDGNYTVVSGHAEPNEAVTSAAVREVLEEVGVSVDLADLQFATVLHRNLGEGRVDFFFSVQRWSGPIENREPSKCDELRWVLPHEIPNNTVGYVRQAIENIQRGSTFDEYWVNEQNHFRVRR
jgi:8-oxo-dGTP pyrophosphatase MutT (NUDIX family)